MALLTDTHQHRLVLLELSIASTYARVLYSYVAIIPVTVS